MEFSISLPVPGSQKAFPAHPWLGLMIQQGTWTITPIFLGSFVFLVREIQLNLAILNHQSGRGPTFLGVCSTNPLPAARGLVKLTTYSIAKNSISERTLGLVIPTTRSNWFRKVRELTMGDREGRHCRPCPCPRPWVGEGIFVAGRRAGSEIEGTLRGPRGPKK